VTRLQLTLLSVVSALSTVAVLAGGAFSADGGPAVSAAALRGPVTVTAALPATAPAAPEPAPAPAADPVTAGSDAGTADAPVTDTADTTNMTATGPATTPAQPSTPAADPAPKPSQIGHVFVISLAGHGFDAAFGPQSQAPYLAQDLRPQGALLAGATTLGSADLPDGLALIGGQPPNADTRAGCPTFKEISPSVKPSKSGEITADGCVFPNTVITIGDQLTASGRTWRAYIEDLDKGTPPKTACRRPGSNAPDDAVTGRPGDRYATRHNPFVYYHSLLDLGDCDSSDGPLGRLDADLASAKTTPSFSYIVPNLCNDGTESPCADGSAGGLPAADAFLATWVPKILASPAFKADGLLIVTFAGSVAPPAAGSAADAPVRNGALLVSRFAKAGSTDDAVYDPYAVLRSVQDLFALKPLARSAKAASFAGTVLASARAPQAGDD
jgi:phosphatidylinositol-3-phosphatase